jgi:hypothetical protein
MMKDAALIKEEVAERCRQALERKVNEMSGAIQQLRNSAAEETKSSAGDKYETAREMIRQEIDKHEMQLNDARRQLSLLEGLPSRENATAMPGSLIETDQGFFFLSISSAPVSTNGITVVPVSLQSPLGAKLLGKRDGDSVIVNQRTYKILSVY